LLKLSFINNNNFNNKIEPLPLIELLKLLAILPKPYYSNVVGLGRKLKEQKSWFWLRSENECYIHEIGYVP
jgi:hypothetical protein